ncbi:MAG: 23S rRNA (adenine(2503)-C(2))-methyltransferase RlmN [Elusimicrobiota bacterium]|jgi:23S rRNA (adenine2503-C2)-methyltransferase|nr:23S rRNA (adenine(2503)-C(2))-methyltransferase RlmN [Elusimicrobiota bacterium]
MVKQHILDLTKIQLINSLKNVIIKEYQIGQILDWIYIKKAYTFEQFSNMHKELRITLDRKFVLRTLKIIKKEKSLIDGTTRYAFQTYDKKRFFAVFLPGKGHNSVCVSSQIGCPISCVFCSSGKTKYYRNLSKGEIVEQVLQIENDTNERVSGVLFMGMGEPSLNFDNLTQSLDSFLSKKEFGIGKRHVTVSSVGNVPFVKKLADKKYNSRLALSLHSVDDKQRRKLIPNNFGFDIKDILKAGNYYLKKTNSRLTVEYVLIKDMNDSSACAHKLARLMRQNHLVTPQTQVNLIPFNPINKSDFQPTSFENIEKFKIILKFNAITATIRKPKGIDIGAACGQLGY